ncbi:ribonuclease P protein component [Candidatus Babeliales bacterium]|nr:ribonuclease P protein component [Candidatus Babeliales bacterium]
MLEDSSFKPVFSFNQKEVTALFAVAKVALRLPGLTVLAASIKEEHQSGKVLIITSRKSGNAVKRNKVRRRLKHLFWTNDWFAAGYSFAIITYKQVHQFSYDELEAIFKKVIKNVKNRQC